MDPVQLGIGIGAVLLLIVGSGWFLLGGKGSKELEADTSPPALTGVAARFASALGTSRAALQGRFDTLFARPFDESVLDELEETMLQADVGIVTVTDLLDSVRDEARKNDDPGHLREHLRGQIHGLLSSVYQPLEDPKPDATGIRVVLVVGVNGSGKTTTIGKLAARWVGQGLKVMVAAGDTYRAAAAEQLEVWAERAGASIVRHAEGADPGAVVYEAMDRARSEGAQVLLIDTAGRLQTKKPLMEQLSKLIRVIQKTEPEGPHETLLVLDGTMGQNGLSQAELFNKATPLTGVIVTKLDGTAKGGMILTIGSELNLPVKMIGIGEKMEDLRPFDVDAFVQVLA